MQAQSGDDFRNNSAGPDDDVAIIIPALNEATVMPRLLRLLGILTPAPAEIIVVDGGKGPFLRRGNLDIEGLLVRFSHAKIFPDVARR